jgi:hypothetical protein
MPASDLFAPLGYSFPGGEWVSQRGCLIRNGRSKPADRARSGRWNIFATVSIFFARNQKDYVTEIFVINRYDAERNRLRKNFSPVVDVECVGKLQS